MKEFPAFIRLKTSGYELIVNSVHDIPQGVAYVVLGRNVQYKKR